jgi:hypothetical protein
LDNALVHLDLSQFLYVLLCLLLLIVSVAVHVERRPFPVAVRLAESPAAIQTHLRLLSVPLCRPAVGQLVISLGLNRKQQSSIYLDELAIT